MRIRSIGWRTWVPLLATGLASAACGGGDDGGDDTGGFVTPDQCNPFGGANCIVPWPSAVYEVDDSSTPTGRRIDVPADALPVNIDDIAIEPALLNARDGFSATAPIIAAFETGVDPANLVGMHDFDRSVTADSPTVLIDMSTGELVPHFAEVDTRGESRPNKQALYIRPATQLKGSTRYAVALKKTLQARGGGELAIPEGFAAILRDEDNSHPLYTRVKDRYPAIFTALEVHGITADDLVTAWDFTTASRESVRADLLDARDAALPLMGTDGDALTYTVDSSEAGGNPAIALRIEGEYDAPLFLNNDGNATATSALLRDGDGKPMPNGVYRAPFVAIVPQCAIDSKTPVPLMIYGHGLLGDADQVGSAGPTQAAIGACVVAIGTDMRGMSTVDVPNVALALNDVNLGGLIFDVLIQGMVNHVALVQIARGPMAQQLFVRDGGGGPDSYIDPDRVYYYGISQGGIMGTTVCGIDPEISRCVLQVGAMNYSLMLERSADWTTYEAIVTGAYPDPLDVALILNIFQGMWDRTEATSVTDVLTGDGFPGTPAKQVFMQFGVADIEVPNVASEYQARTMGIPVMTPSPYVPWGMASSATPAASGLVIFDFGLGDTIPEGNEAPPDNEVHGSIRRRQATVDMIREFFDNGLVTQLCTAPTGCDCTGDGCGATL
jgi:hypothetical protein